MSVYLHLYVLTRSIRLQGLSKNSILYERQDTLDVIKIIRQRPKTYTEVNKIVGWRHFVVTRTF